jgi:hypothetical protein
MVATCGAQTTQENQFSRKYTWTLFAEESPTSSHILMGYSRNRVLVDAGGAFTIRVARFFGSDLSYHMEIRPVLFESDPLAITNYTVTIQSTPPLTFSDQQVFASPLKCVPGSGTITDPGVPGGEPPSTETYKTVCGRQWTFGQQFAPIGFKYSLRTRHRLQPFVIGTLGYMYTSRPVPVADAEGFNFVWDFGAGLELYRTGKRSVSVETRIHHLSNRDTAPENPGIDSIVYKVSYSFGK